MTLRHIRRKKREMLTWLDDKLGLGYKMGARGHGDPEMYDCRGLAEAMYTQNGVGEAMGGTHVNVRAEVKWAKDNQRFREPSVAPKSCWWIFYNEPTAMPGPNSNPDCIRHVAIAVEPPSDENPAGLAISALNPHLGIREHGFNLKGLAIYGFCKPDWDRVGASDVPITDPEPPITPEEP